MPDEMMKPILYNLTWGHLDEVAEIPEVAIRWRVEIVPRLQKLEAVNLSELRRAIQSGLKNIPPGSDDIIDGPTLVRIVAMCLRRFNVYYVHKSRPGDSSRPKLLGVIFYKDSHQAKKGPRSMM